MQSPSLGFRAHRKIRAFGKGLEYWVTSCQPPLSPAEWRASRFGPRILLNSMPKAGTNLLSRAVTGLPLIVRRWTRHLDELVAQPLQQLARTRRGQAVTAHIPWSEFAGAYTEELAIKTILIVRDPRDIVVSGMNYVTYSDKSHLLHAYFTSLGSDDERLMAYIKGVPPSAYPTGRVPRQWTQAQLSGFVGWLQEESCLVVRFEDLIGSEGNGSDARQRGTLAAIATHLGVTASEADIDACSRQVFHRGAKTFRLGQAGGWRSVFGAHHTEAFMERHGALLKSFGYE